MDWLSDLPGALPLERTLDGVVGTEVLEVTEDRARGRVRVTDRVRGPSGAVHSGVYAILAESIVSVAESVAVRGRGMVATGMSNLTDVREQIVEGCVNGEARRRYGDDKGCVWDVDFTDDRGRLCAVTRITVAIRPQPTDRLGPPE